MKFLQKLIAPGKRSDEEPEMGVDLDSLMAALTKPGQDSGTRQKARNRLVKLGFIAVTPLIGLLSHSEADLRFRAALGLGDIGDRRAVKPLISALKDDVSYVRQGAAMSLGRIKDPSAVAALGLSLKEEQDEYARGAIREALNSIGGPEAEAALLGKKWKPPSKKAGHTITLWAADQSAAEQLATDEFFLMGVLMSDGSSAAQGFREALERGGTLSHRISLNPVRGGFNVELTLR